MLDPSRFVVAVDHLVGPLRRELEGRQFSDVLDADGRQYVDLVLDGRGMLGMALVGYTYVLEQVGIRFLGIGGSSAGAINAILLAALDDRSHAKSEDLLRLLAGQNFQDFLDGDADARRMLDTALRGGSLLSMLYACVQARESVEQHWGLNPGHAFRDWLRRHLHAAGVDGWADLRTRLESGALVHRSGAPYLLPPAEQLLAIVAHEVTTATKVVFPRMAPLFWDDPDQVHPVEFVRAAVATPFVFRPVRVRTPQGPEAAGRWSRLVGFDGSLSRESVLVDGANVAPFPIDLFHLPEHVPAAPTFGVRLGVDRSFARHPRGPLQLARAVIDAERHRVDYDFVMRHPDYGQLVTIVPTHPYQWADTAMPDEDRIGLFVRGAEAACAFLRRFDWSRYKQVRHNLADAHAAGALLAGVAAGELRAMPGMR